MGAGAGVGDARGLGRGVGREVEQVGLGRGHGVTRAGVARRSWPPNAGSIASTSKPAARSAKAKELGVK